MNKKIKYMQEPNFILRVDYVVLINDRGTDMILRYGINLKIGGDRKEWNRRE